MFKLHLHSLSSTLCFGNWTLAETIRGDPDIKGFQVGQTTHEINLLADDIILDLKDPNNSLCKLQTVLNTYGSISGYKVNLEKS